MKQQTKSSILYIDINVPETAQLKQYLTRRGYAVNWQPAIGIALLELTQSAPDLVLVDVYRYTDQMTAEAFIKGVHAKMPKMPVVIFTDEATIVNAIDCKVYAADDFLSKLTNPAKLELRLDHAIKRARSGGPEPT